MHLSFAIFVLASMACVAWGQSLQSLRNEQRSLLTEQSSLECPPGAACAPLTPELSRRLARIKLRLLELRVLILERELLQGGGGGSGGGFGFGFTADKDEASKPIVNERARINPKIAEIPQNGL